MTPDEYEQLLSSISCGICQATTELQCLSLGTGRNNRIPGASGYAHQIDVSLKGDSSIFLIECKRWKDRIGVAELLVLAGRTSDIRAAYPECSVTAILVSMRGASRGALQLAEHFGINIEVVTSPSEFGLRIGRFVHQATSDGVQLSDHSEATVMRKGAIIME